MKKPRNIKIRELLGTHVYAVAMTRYNQKLKKYLHITDK